MSRSRLIWLVAFVGIGSAAWGTPVISGVVTQGDTLTVSGTGFGANVGLSSLAWTGAGIEEGTPGAAFAAPGWWTCSDSGSFTTPRYSTARSHSGAQSVLCRIKDGDDGTGDGETNEYSSNLHFDAGSDFTSVYFTWWCYFKDNVPGQGQWKIWRVMNDGSVRDTNTHAMSSQWFNSDGSSYQCYWISSNPASATGPPGMVTHWESQLAYKGEWMRFEIYMISGDDGHMLYSVYTTEHGVRRLADEDVSFATDTRYLVLQNYWGNHGDSVYPDDLEIYLDDIFIQLGTQARVEIGDASTWNACTHKEIQLPTAWASGEIDVTLNAGSFTPADTVYLYVVDEQGQVNANGYALSGFGLHPGDANADGIIDGVDLAIWQENYDPLGLNDNNTFAMGDWDGDGDIDGADLALWQEYYAPLGYLGEGGIGAPSAGTAHIPEPATAGLFLVGSGFLLLLRRRSRP